MRMMKMKADDEDDEDDEEDEEDEEDGEDEDEDENEDDDPLPAGNLLSGGLGGYQGGIEPGPARGGGGGALLGLFGAHVPFLFFKITSWSRHTWPSLDHCKKKSLKMSMKHWVLKLDTWNPTALLVVSSTEST